jgi:hypothetical protein
LQKTAAGKMYPAQIQLRAVDHEPDELKLLRIRVYAARDYRDQTNNWQPRFRRLLERVNQRVRGWPGVRFEVVEFKSWEIDTQQASINSLIEELIRKDPGNDVDYVVGLASAVALWPNNLHQLGGANIMGKHFVMRGLHDLTEYSMVVQELNLIDDSDREQLITARKAHKEEICFLHEWAHTLGAIHTRGPRFIMTGTYDHEQFTMDDGNARVLILGLNRRNSPNWGPELKAMVEKQTFDDWDFDDRKKLLALLANWRPRPEVDRPAPVQTKVEKGPATPHAGKVDLSYHEEAPPPPAPAEASAQGTKSDDMYQRSVEAGREALIEGKLDTATMLAKQLQRDYPSRPGGAALLEDVAAGKAAGKRDLKGAMQHLRRAIELDPTDRAAWAAAGEIARFTHDEKTLAKIREEYEKRFGKPLPGGR